MNRRAFIERSALLAGSVAILGTLAPSCGNGAQQSEASPAGSYPYQLSALPYAYAALEPAIDAETLELHHSKHHAAYIAKLNEALAAQPDQQPKALEVLFAEIAQLPPPLATAIRNHGGGHWNHAFFWKLLAPTGPVKMPDTLAQRFERDFGSLDKVREQFAAAALSVFGSGWAWIVRDVNDRLVITTSRNQENPLMADQPTVGTPILGLDVWEHAYYLQYQNRRAAYIEAIWDRFDWQAVAQLAGV
jgi:Fe-Mn family superoxide dismutase